MARERILVADDRFEIREFIRDVLVSKEFDVLMARDGIECMKQVEENPPNLILLDLQMPRMDGLQVLDALKKGGHKIPVILMTAHGNEGIVVEVFRKGVRDYIIKAGDTFSLEEMLEAIERSLSMERLRRENHHLHRSLHKTNTMLQSRLNELNVLYQVGRAVAQNLSQRRLMHLIMAGIMNITNCDECGIFFIEEDELVCLSYKFPKDSVPTVLNKPMHDALARQTINTWQALLSPHEIGTPIVYGKSVIGALVVKNTINQEKILDEHEAALLRVLADYAAVGYQMGHVPPHTGNTPPPLKPQTIFVSYAHSDYEAYIKPLIENLTNNHLNVWVDRSELRGGQNWMNMIGKALDEASVMVLGISPEALQSRFVQMEYQYFVNIGRPIIPVICKPARLPPELSSLHNIPHTETDLLLDWLQAVFKA